MSSPSTPATYVLHSLLLDGLALIERLTGVTPDQAAGAIVIIREVIENLRAAQRGTVSPEVVRAEWTRLQASIATNDANADAALAAKFDDSDVKQP